MTEPAHNAAPDLKRAQRKSRTWGVVTTALLLTIGAVLMYLVVITGQQDSRLTAFADVIDQQNNLYPQLCKLAGGQVNTDPAAREACARVERGEPAVPIPVVITGPAGPTGANGVGIRRTRQLDRCFIEVELTNGAINQFGSFCGADGSVGPTGPTGISGETGQPGASGRRGVPGVGVADVRTANNPCLVEVSLTDGTTRTVGPFCGPPLGEFTMTEQNGETKRCVRDGGSDAQPNYACRVEPAPTTTTPPPITSTSARLIPTP